MILHGHMPITYWVKYENAGVFWEIYKIQTKQNLATAHPHVERKAQGERSH